jgi:hypothetical protein
MIMSVMICTSDPISILAMRLEVARKLGDFAPCIAVIHSDHSRRALRMCFDVVVYLIFESLPVYPSPQQVSQLFVPVLPSSKEFLPRWIAKAVYLQVLLACE